MKTYAVTLYGLLEVTAHVVAESSDRAAEIAWRNDDPRPGESVVYQQGMSWLGPPEVDGNDGGRYDGVGGPEISGVYEVDAVPV